MVQMLDQKECLPYDSDFQILTLFWYFAFVKAFAL